MIMASKKKAKTSNQNPAGTKKVRLRTLKDHDMLTEEQARGIKGGRKAGGEQIIIQGT
jgi:hypothetical protein